MTAAPGPAPAPALVWSPVQVLVDLAIVTVVAWVLICAAAWVLHAVGSRSDVPLLIVSAAGSFWVVVVGEICLTMRRESRRVKAAQR